MRALGVGYHSNMSTKKISDGVAVPLDIAPIDGGPAGDLADENAAADVADVAVIHRLDAAVNALGEVDFGSWSDSALSGHLNEVSLVLCRVDAQLSRLADAVRSRGFDIAEIDLRLAS